MVADGVCAVRGEEGLHMAPIWTPWWMGCCLFGKSRSGIKGWKDDTLSFRRSVLMDCRTDHTGN